MLSKLRKLAIFVISSGFDPRKLLYSILFLPVFLRHVLWFFNTPSSDFKKKLLPVLSDKFENAGIATGHYFWCDLVCARWIYKDKPAELLDVGSRIDGFVAHILTFRQINVLDIRDMSSQVVGLNFLKSDLSKPNIKIGEYDAISSLHAIEHFGLGRYGDPLDIDGWKQALCNFHLNLKESGTLYLATPISEENTIHFNAHRTFNFEYLLKNCEEVGFRVLECVFIDDHGNLAEFSQLGKNYAYSCAIMKLQCIK